MAVVARYQPEGCVETYPTLQQAQIADVLLNKGGPYLESYRLKGIVEILDKHLIIYPRPVEGRVEETEEEKNETL